MLTPLLFFITRTVALRGVSEQAVISGKSGVSIGNCTAFRHERSHMMWQCMSDKEGEPPPIQVDSGAGNRYTP